MRKFGHEVYLIHRAVLNILWMHKNLSYLYSILYLHLPTSQVIHVLTNDHFCIPLEIVTMGNPIIWIQMVDSICSRYTMCSNLINPFYVGYSSTKSASNSVNFLDIGTRRSIITGSISMFLILNRISNMPVFITPVTALGPGDMIVVIDLPSRKSETEPLESLFPVRQRNLYQLFVISLVPDLFMCSETGDALLLLVTPFV